MAVKAPRPTVEVLLKDWISNLRFDDIGNANDGLNDLHSSLSTMPAQNRGGITMMPLSELRAPKPTGIDLDKAGGVIEEFCRGSESWYTDGDMVPFECYNGKYW